MKGMLIDSTGDLLIQNGKLVIGECSADVAERVLRAYPGEFKELPSLGLYAAQQLNGTPDPFWRGTAKRQLAIAGVNASEVDIKDGEIMIQIAS